jgi:hypothetical protein
MSEATIYVIGGLALALSVAAITTLILMIAM